MSWPSSTDPFYLANSADQNARRSYYGVNSIPAGFGNGATVGGSASSWRSSGLSNIGTYTPIAIEFNGGMVDGELQMSVTVSSETNQSSSDLRLFVMTSIDSVYYNSPSAYDNFHNVFIEFLTNSSGQSLSLDGVTNYIQEFNWSMPSPWPNNNTNILWDISDLNVIAFVQNYSSKDVLQAEWARTNDMNIDIILSLTHSGSTARMIARYKPSADIVALTPIEKTYRQLSIIWGVTPNMIKQYSSSDDIPSISAKFINDNNILISGNRYVVTGGVPVGVAGTTNYLFVQKAK